MCTRLFVEIMMNMNEKMVMNQFGTYWLTL